MIQTQESRPNSEFKAALNLDTPSLPDHAGFKVDGALVIDLRVSGGPYGGNDHVVERRIQHATNAPHGADVTFIVSARQYPPMFGISYLREHGSHLKSVVVQSDCPDTISTWWSALRGEVL